MTHDKRLLGVYYFRGGMFTCVPGHIREELDETVASTKAIPNGTWISRGATLQGADR